MTPTLTLLEGKADEKPTLVLKDALGSGSCPFKGERNNRFFFWGTFSFLLFVSLFSYWFRFSLCFSSFLLGPVPGMFNY